MTDRLINPDTGEVITPADPKALAGLFAKLAKVMGNLSRLPKNGYNSHFKYNFVTDADVSDTIRAALAAEGIAFFASLRDAEYNGDKVVGRFTFTFADSTTGVTWSCDWMGEGQDRQDKGTAKAATSALKYFLLKNFLLSTGDPADDSDNDAPAKPKAQKQGKKQQPKPPAANGNGANEVARAQFFARVLDEIPYYNHVAHVGNTLKALGYTGYKVSAEEEMFAALQKHASEKANEEA